MDIDRYQKTILSISENQHNPFDWFPVDLGLVAIGVNMMNLALSISLSLTVIAIGWIAYRPLMGIAILAMAATPFFMAKYRSRGAHGHRSYE